ncbi:MAG: hypothetical protein JW812_03140 [Alphaproteobacteria bacterium]|nr:hypothetical protein [Alphaproteobacteria bacterium]MBN2779760.1 hypothetical protein [Alphaproteobacteria bacterium]
MKKYSILFFSLFLITGCGLKEHKRGHLISPEISQEVPKLRSKSAIVKTLGTPDAENLYGPEDIWMYLSYEKEQTAFFKPKDVKYDLILFHFKKGQNRIKEIKRYDLSQKIALKPDSDKTPIPGAIELSPLEELFKNIGRFTPGMNGG